MLTIGNLFDVGDIVRALRLRLKIKGEKTIREKLKTDKDTISRIERTSKYDPDILERIARGLGTSSAEILHARDSIKRMKPASLLASNLCLNPDHARLQKMVDEILHSQASYNVGGEMVPVRHGIAINIEAHYKTAIQSGTSPEGNNAPYDWSRYKTGDDVIEGLSPKLKEEVAKTKRKRRNRST